jgi:adenylate cyclase
MKLFERVRIRMELKEVLWIALAWLLISLTQFLYEYSIISRYVDIANDIDLLGLLCVDLFTIFFAGIFGGSVIVFFLEKWIRTKAFGMAMIMIIISYTAIFLIVVAIAHSLHHMQELEIPIFFNTDESFWKSIISVEYIRNFFFWLLIFFGTLIALMVRDKYGPGVFKDFLLGKYFSPKRETRIFMFLDIRSSTTIAEQLGENKYFHFLQDFFKDATSSIIYSKGEIYQYVGDEIVVTWKVKDGNVNPDFIRCFFDIQDTIRQRSKLYRQRYGVVPEFKAGFHFGHVMAGEIGVVKRDIAFSGDVLNTASRIQNMCNKLGVNILISKALLDRVALAPHTYQPKRVGSMMLRGKNERVVLYTL